jgi:hypothetical protein
VGSSHGASGDGLQRRDRRITAFTDHGDPLHEHRNSVPGLGVSGAAVRRRRRPVDSVPCLAKGDQMVTEHSPLPVLIGHDRSAWVVLDKYRCDLAARAAVGHIEFRLGAEGRLGAVAPDSAGWAYCGPGGPGSIVHVSPFEARRLAALRQG